MEKQNDGRGPARWAEFVCSDCGCWTSRWALPGERQAWLAGGLCLECGTIADAPPQARPALRALFRLPPVQRH